MNIKLLAGMILVLPEKAEEKTSGGIYLPGTANKSMLTGKVKAIGNGKEGEPMELSVGNTVHFPRHSGIKVDIGDIEYLIMRQKEINYFI